MKGRVFDLFMYFNEADILELRLNILDPHVDYFIIGEGEETFSGNEKPFYFDTERFKKWEDKIIHHHIKKHESSSVFERARFQKESLLDAIPNPQPEDVIYYGDVDEIWKPKEVINEVQKFQQLNYSYYLNNRSSEEWRGTIMGKYKDIIVRGLNDLRAKPYIITMQGGWHFTNMGGVEQIIKKIEAYDHQEYNNVGVRNQLAERMARGDDYVGRERDWQGKPFRFWLDESEWPEYLKIHKNEYKHLCLPTQE